MTFANIAYKMFRAEIKNYRLFTLCNLISIAILYAFLSIYENEQFNDSAIIDPMISSNIIAPTYLVLLYTAIFIPYTQRVFLKSRQKDYGILLTLGMTENEFRFSVFVENIILCIAFLAGGLILGTFLSLFFLMFIKNIMDFKNVTLSISVDAYKLTSLYVLGLFLLSIIVNFLAMIKTTVYEKIKYTDKAESKYKHSIKLCVAGAALTILAFAIMVAYFHTNSNVWFLSLLLCILGSMLIFYNGKALIEAYQKKHPEMYRKNIFVISDINYYYGKNKNIFFSTTWIFFAIFFFIMLSIFTYPSLKENAITYHPFHLAYSELESSFVSLEDSEIRQIAGNDDNAIILDESVDFVTNGKYAVFSIEDVNRIFNMDLKVEQNSCIHVYTYDLNDGYEHDTDYDYSSINIEAVDSVKELKVAEKMTDPLFGQINSIPREIILVSEQDFEWITLHSITYCKGGLHLYNFENWRDSEKIINEVWNKLIIKNNIKESDNYYKISSRITAYNTAEKSSDFLLFVMIYACLLLYFSAIIMIHFKLKMEYATEKKKMYSLYRIGMQESGMKKMILQKIFIIFSVSFSYAVLLTIAYSYYTTVIYGYGLIGILCALITVTVFSIIHFTIYKLYSGSYYSKMISEL